MTDLEDLKRLNDEEEARLDLEKAKKQERDHFLADVTIVILFLCVVIMAIVFGL